MPSELPIRVLILGGGFAGLQTALTILRLAPGLKPVILEARDRLGGRAYTYVGAERPVDLGASFVHGWDTGNPMRERIDELGGRVHIVEGKDTFIIGKDGWLDAPAASSLTSAFSSASDSLHSGLRSQDCSADRDIESAVASVASDPAVRSLLRTTEIGAGVALSRLSAQHFTFPRPFAGVDAAPVGGYAAVVAALWRQLESRGAEVVYRAQVRGVARAGAEVVVSADVAGSAQTFRAAYTVCTIPLGVLRAASPPAFSPPLEPATQAAIDRTEVGLLNKVLLAYDQPWWPRPSEAAKYLVLPEVDDRPTTRSEKLGEILGKVTLSVDNLYASAREEGWPALLVPLGAAGAWAIESERSDDTVGRELHGYLARRLGAMDAPTGPKAVVVTRWGSDPFAGGATSAPVCVPAPGARGDAVPPSPLDFIQMGRPTWEGRLGFAGEHTDPDHRGSVAGALISGEREGQRVAKHWLLKPRVVAEGD